MTNSQILRGSLLVSSETMVLVGVSLIMSWKIERWLKDVFPGKEQIYGAYRHLRGRELLIVASAVFEAALAELLDLRFRDLPAESAAFLGANGDGRAPAASFGARIQLALLLGIITERDAAVLRQLKTIRNMFAHRAVIDIVGVEATTAFRLLLERWKVVAAAVTDSTAEELTRKFQPISENLGKRPEAAEGLILALLSIYQAYFHLLSEQVTRVDDVVFA